MGEFYDSISADLDALDSAAGGPGADMGVDYTSNSTVVREVQTAINAQGYSPPLVADGAYGPKTIAGVKWLQTRAGLQPDGVIGEQTLGALGITPPTGVSVEYAKGAGKAAMAAVQQQFSSLMSWAAANPQPLTQGKGVAPGFNATRASVVKSFIPWTNPLEGWVDHMYLDELGYVTTGLGNKIDSIGEAQSLPWLHANGSQASAQEVATEWASVDSHRTAPKGQQQNLPGGGAQKSWTTLHITPAAIQGRIDQQLKSNEQHILSAMPEFAKAPASAQMAVHSMSWAMGPGRFANEFTHFTNAFNAGDYATAAAQSTMKGSGIQMRNEANRLLLSNAAQAKKARKSDDTLFYIDNLSDLYSASSILKIIGVLAGVIAFVGAIFAFTGGKR